MITIDRKYAQLLLKRCLSFNNTDTLLIEYTTFEHDDFVKTIIEEAKKMKIKNIKTYLRDSDEYHKYLKNTDLENIKLNPLLDRSIWDEVAYENGCILHIRTYIPNLMNDIKEEKIIKASKITLDTFKYYVENQTKFKFPWVICDYPNKRWAKFLFPNDKNAYKKLYNYIVKSCMLDEVNPLEAWDKFIKQNNYYKRKLQGLEIKTLHYKNSLGTDFKIGFNKNNIWLNLDDKDQFGSPIILNMPSYEIFTTPDFKTANGIVYNSKPLVYNGLLVDKFFIEFKDGVVVNYNAEIGNEVLTNIFKNYKNSNRLGEVALVDCDSPISKTNIVFYDTLFDENSSCHLALGKGFPICIKNGTDMIESRLENEGVNVSNVHIDFMIGTNDLEIEAETKNGKVLIFKDGKFNI